jgi:hypothetical protein
VSADVAWTIPLLITDGEDVAHHKDSESEKALAHGEACQAEKRKHRWG